MTAQAQLSKPSKEETATGKEGKEATGTMAGKETGMDAIALLKKDHRTVEELFEKFEKATTRLEKEGLAKKICSELIMHATIEEDIFYPACRQHVDDRMLDEAQVEHDSAKTLIAELMAGSPAFPEFDAIVKVLSEQVKHHIGEEEKRSDSIFEKAKQSGLDVDALGKQMQDRKSELISMMQSRGLGFPRPKLLFASIEFFQGIAQEGRMPRRSTMPERDERGRFVSEDDDFYRGSRSRSMMNRYRDDDDDDDRRMRRSRGGWFGDFEGHSEAARRGWDERMGMGMGRYDRDEEFGPSRRFSRHFEDDRYGRAMEGRGYREGFEGRGGYREFDDRGFRGRSRDFDEDDERMSMSGSRRGQGEWGNGERFEMGRGNWEERGYRNRPRDFEDDDYYNRRSSRGSSHGGWFGDSEGHSEAARRGWENRGYSRSRDFDDEDDDDREMAGSHRGGRSHGGWFGDSEGHSQAARRGWRNR